MATLMNYNSIITNLYFMLIIADGTISEKEITSGDHMINVESINETEFKAQMASAKSRDQAMLLRECLAGLKKLNRNQQIRIIAWLCVVANADGFMDRAEWQLIYRIYHKELNLPLEEIFKVQKELSRLAAEKSSVITKLNTLI